MKNFRKKSILFICLGLAIATIAFANVIDPPGQPGKPKAIDWGVDFCVIEWTRPSHDGGSQIVSYDTEKRESGIFTRWVSCGTTNGPKTKHTVKGLQEGRTYEFRAIASNIAGKSKPSEPSAPIIAKPR